MTRLFTPILVIHVVVAVVGLGTVLSVALVASVSRRSGRGAPDVSAWLAPLLRLSAISLAAMLLTGILMDVALGGMFHDWWWFRASALLLVLTGALHARARRIAGRNLATDGGREVTLRRIERLAYGMSALIAAITVLMEAKPF